MDRGPDLIENRTFDEIRVGDTASMKRTLTEKDIQLFALVSGDINPAHLDAEYAANTMFHEVIAHGLWGGSLISAVLGTVYPGPGTIYIDQKLHFSRPVSLGDSITVTVTVKEKFEHTKHVILDCHCVNQNGKTVIRGDAEVLAPADKVRRPRVQLPEVRLLDASARYRRLTEAAKGKAPIRTAVVHPCDKQSLGGALSAAEAGLIVPVLIGPIAKLAATAGELGVDLARFTVEDVEHSHDAAAKAVALVRAGNAEALMKGSLHTDELMGEVVRPGTGLRTARRLSHVFYMELPAYPKPLLITDAAVNIEPDLDAKVDIVQNAIDLALALGIAQPKVAILAAVETVNAKMRATLDAAALCKMAERGQIRGGIVDGPLAVDNAVSYIAAKTKGINSAVAGQADILVVPDLESGNIVAKQLEYLADAGTAGVVMGARVPIVLTSRADSVAARVASCAIALLLARAEKPAA